MNVNAPKKKENRMRPVRFRRLTLKKKQDIILYIIKTIQVKDHEGNKLGKRNPSKRWV